MSERQINQWFISANPEFYDTVGAFNELGEIDWKQAENANFSKGDIVYIYVSHKVHALKIKAEISDTNLTFDQTINDSKFVLNKDSLGTSKYYMRLKMIKNLNGSAFERDKLELFGFKTPQGPVKVLNETNEYLSLIERLQATQELDPNTYDASNELVKEVVKSYSKVSDYSSFNYNDLNLIYLSTVGTWKHSVEKKKETILNSNLPEDEKNHLIDFLSDLWERVKKGEFSHSEEENKISFGMFGTGFYNTKTKTDDESVHKFIKMCVDLLSVEEDETAFEIVDQVISPGFNGLAAAGISVILYCLKPFIFPIINSHQGKNNIFEKLGIEIKKPASETTYVSNSRKIKEYRDANFNWKNYRIFDMENIETSQRNYLQEIYDTAISHEHKSLDWVFYSWYPLYESCVKEYVEQGKSGKWTDSVFQRLVKDVHDNGISDLPQGNFTWEEYKLIKSNWNEIQPTITQIADSNSISDKQYKEISDFLAKYTKQKRRAGTNRVIAAFLPNVITTAVTEAYFYKTIYKLKEFCKDYPDITNNWLEDNKRFIAYCNKNVNFKIPWHSSIFCWYLFELYEEEQYKKEKEGERMEELINQVRRAKNIIFTGAPGTGKTFLAEEIAARMGAVVKLVQFHPSYDYTDFVEGLRPIEKNGILGFERRDGAFKNFCKKAIESSAEGNVDNFDDALKIMLARFDENNEGIDIPLLSGKGTFRIALNSNEDGFVTLSQKEDGTYEKESSRFYNFEQCYRVYRNLPGVPKGGFDNYRKAIVEYMKTNCELKEYNPGQISDNSDKPFVFIIDEINRGEVAKIFGELFYAIDPGYRGKKEKSVQTQYQNLIKEDDVFSDGFYVPENVYIIGTMNDIDRSVESIDFAFRRRFTWKEITAEQSIRILDNEEAWKAYGEQPSAEIIEKLKTRLHNLNREISKTPGLNSAYHIGASYLLKYALYNESEAFDLLWKNHLEGVLFEYLRGRPHVEELLKEFKDAFANEEFSDDEIIQDEE